MKKWISMLLAVVMSCSVMTVPAFAIEGEQGNYCEYGLEYGESGGQVGVIRKTDEFGKTIYVHGSPLNNKVFALVNAPAMDYTKTIGSVTFSNYIKHNEKTLRDAKRNSVNVTQVYVGIGASMRSEVDRVEFMCSVGNTFNFMSGPLQAEGGYDLTSDLVQIKTNTPAYQNIITSTTGGELPTYRYLDYFSIRPYTNLGRNYDGTWQKGLTWVFEEHTKSIGTEGGAGWGYAGDPNKYMKIYSIRVESPNGTEYFQVIVTDEKNFAGEKQEIPAAPVAPAEPVAPVAPAAPATPAAPALKSFKDVESTRWSYNAIMEMVGLGMFSGTTAPDANGVGTFDPTGVMSRAQYLVVVSRFLYGDELDTMPAGKTWYSNHYDLAVKHGLVTESEFPFASVNEPLTRQEMALIAVRTARAQGAEMPELVSTDRIADYDTIGSYYKDFVRQAFSMGLLSGYDDKGTVGPNDTLTREQGAMVAYRLVNIAP